MIFQAKSRCFSQDLPSPTHFGPEVSERQGACESRPPEMKTGFLAAAKCLTRCLGNRGCFVLSPSKTETELKVCLVYAAALTAPSSTVPPKSAHVSSTEPHLQHPGRGTSLWFTYLIPSHDSFSAWGGCHPPRLCTRKRAQRGSIALLLAQVTVTGRAKSLSQGFSTPTQGLHQGLRP